MDPEPEWVPQIMHVFASLGSIPKQSCLRVAGAAAVSDFLSVSFGGFVPDRTFG